MKASQITPECREDAIALERWRHVKWLLLALVVILGAQILGVRGDKLQLPGVGESPSLCLWQQLFDVSCPGCGLTRSVVTSCQGSWGLAWHFNPAGLLVAAVCFAQVPYRVYRLLRPAGPVAISRLADRWRVGLIWVGFVGFFALLLLQWAWR